MIKNMTRKGLAIGATAALTLAGLVGFAAPAQAASAITVEPSKGTSYTMVSGQQLDLRVFGNAEFGTNFANLKWEVTNADKETISVFQGATDAADAAVSTGISLATPDAERIIVTPTARAATGANQLGISVGASVATTLQVRAFIDLNGNGTYEAASDLSANVVTVTFVKVADVVPTIVFDAPKAGDTTVKATVSFDLNNEQLASGAANLTGTLTYADGSGLTVTSPAVAAWTAAKKFEFTATVDDDDNDVSGLAKDKALKLQMRVNPDPGSGLADAGAAAVQLITARAAESFRLQTVASTNVTAGQANFTGGTASNGAANARIDGTYDLRVTAQANTAFLATDGKAVSGAAVTVTFSTSAALKATGDDAKSITIAGTSFTAAGKLPGQGDVAGVALTTGADGTVSWPMSTSGFEDSDTITVTVKVENLPTIQLVITSQDLAYTAHFMNGNVRQLLAGGTASVDVAVYDQFGGVPAAGFDVRALISSTTADVARTGTGSKSATALSNSNVALVNGRATLTVTDNGAGAGKSVYDVEVPRRVAGGGYAATAAASVGSLTLEFGATVPSAGVVTITGTAPNAAGVYARSGTLSQKDNGSFDSRGVLGSAPEHGNFVVLDGSVKTAVSATAAQVAIKGTPVTLSGAGLQFKTTVNSKDVFAVDSITVYTNGDGDFAASVASNKAGKQTVTITSGGASRTVEITFTAAPADTGAFVDIFAPASVLPGSTLSVTVKVTDKYGNPVKTDGTKVEASNQPQVNVSYVGPGLVVGSNVGQIANQTDANGEITFIVMMGANDRGTATITARHQLANAEDDDNDVIVQRSVVVGTAAAVAGTARAWTRDMGDGTIKMYARDVVGAGKIQFFHNGREVAWIRAVDATDPKLNVRADGMVRTRALVSGRNVFEIHVDGERIVRRIATGS